MKGLMEIAVGVVIGAIVITLITLFGHIVLYILHFLPDFIVALFVKFAFGLFTLVSILAVVGTVLSDQYALQFSVKRKDA